MMKLKLIKRVKIINDDLTINEELIVSKKLILSIIILLIIISTSIMILLINSNKVNLLINDELGTSLARSDSLLELIEKTDFDTRKNNLYYYYGKYNTCSHNDKPTLEKIFLFAKECESWYPDIIAAQAQLESNSGTSDVFKHTNNLFGMRVVHNQ